LRGTWPPTPRSKKLEEDEESGEQRYVYIRSGPEYFSVAFTWTFSNREWNGVVARFLWKHSKCLGILRVMSSDARAHNEAFRVNDHAGRQVTNRKRRIQYRLRDRTWDAQEDPMLSASNIQYEMADRARGLTVGGIGMVHLLARRTGLVDAIEKALQVRAHMFWRVGRGL